MSKNNMNIWQEIQQNAQDIKIKEPILSKLINKYILAHTSFQESLIAILTDKLADHTYNAEDYKSIFDDVLTKFPQLITIIEKDLIAIKDRDPSCQCYTLPMLYYKGFHAIQIARITNKLWHNDQKYLAQYLQNRSSEFFGVDIHPNVEIGYGILLDHATSFVAGETATIGNNVSILHEVTLGGSGKIAGDRHPKIGDDVLIGAGAKLLGNINIGKGSKIGAGSVVLNNVPKHVTVVGVPAKIIGTPSHSTPGRFMDQRFI